MSVKESRVHEMLVGQKVVRNSVYYTCETIPGLLFVRLTWSPKNHTKFTYNCTIVCVSEYMVLDSTS